MVYGPWEGPAGEFVGRYTNTYTQAPDSGLDCTQENTTEDYPFGYPFREQASETVEASANEPNTIWTTVTTCDVDRSSPPTGSPPEGCTLSDREIILYSDTQTTTFDQEVTDEELIAKVTASLPAWDNDWNDTPGSVRVLGCKGANYQFRQSRYKIRHPLPKRSQSTGCYRVDWVVRFVPAITYEPQPTAPCSTAFPNGGGASLTSVEVFAGGSGWGPGTTVTFGAPGNGGTTATATVSVNDQGKITAINLTNPGSRYLTAPSVSLTGTGSGVALGVHMGEETPLSYAWNGTMPSGYHAANPETHPESSIYELPEGDANGTWSMELVRYRCEGCSP